MEWLPIDATPRPLVVGAIPASALGWGMWRLTGSGAETRRLVETALECGLTLLDTADIYGTGEAGFGSAEALLGAVLAQAPHLRQRMLLASKGGIVPGVPYDSRKDYLIRACEASLTRLRTDRIDLYQVHRPDLLAHPAEVAAALAQLHDQGKIGAVGLSNYSATQARALQRHLPFDLMSLQPEFSVLETAVLRDGIIDLAMEKGCALLAWSPLAGGRIADAALDDRSRAVVDRLDRIAERENVSRAAVAYAWLLAHPSRPIPLIGTQKPERIRDSINALRVRMTAAEWYGLLEASMGSPLP